MQYVNIPLSETFETALVEHLFFYYQKTHDYINANLIEQSQLSA